MEFVSSIENIMLKIGPTRITCAVLLDERPDIDALYHQMAAIVEKVPRLRTMFSSFFVWYVSKPANFNLDNHFAVLDDPSITDTTDIDTLLEQVRRFDLPEEAPPWLMIAVNASRRGAASGLPAVVFHFDHAIADGIRALEIVTRYPSDPAIRAAAATAKAQNVAGPAKPMQFADLTTDDRIIPLPLVGVNVSLADLKAVRTPGHDLSDQIIGGINTVLADRDLFEQSVKRQGKVALVRLTQRRVGVGDLGNHVSVVDRDVASAQAQATSRRGMLPSLKAEKTHQARQVWMAPMPGSLTRSLAGKWYAQFDALLTIIPGGRNPKSFGDAPIDRVYGVAPILADIPLNIAAITYGDRISLTFLAKNLFLGDKSLLRTRLHEALLSGASVQPAVKQGEPVMSRAYQPVAFLAGRSWNPAPRPVLAG
ncbi:MAG: WS/DGAT domain-containing protein [Alphaproteobacteria bacterium]